MYALLSHRFVSIEYTDKDLVSALYEDGHEIAVHTVTHPMSPDINEIGLARDWLVNEAGVPSKRIKGFRSPFLAHTPEVRGYLYDLGFRYDSTITEQASPFSSTSLREDERVFPYTLQDGIAQNCAIGTGTCRDDERYPGMWEIPMWLIEDDDGSPIASMDLPDGVDANEAYTRELHRNYFGNRAPLGLFLHAGLAANSVNSINDFIRYALSLDDVWFVTNSQLLDFMTNPMSAAQYRLFNTRQRQCPSRSAFDVADDWQSIAATDYSDGTQMRPATRVPPTTAVQPPNVNGGAHHHESLGSSSSSVTSGTTPQLTSSATNLVMATIGMVMVMVVSSVIVVEL